MKRKNNIIVIRTDLKYGIIFLFFSIIFCFIAIEEISVISKVSFIIMSVLWIIMAILASLPKVTLYLERINEGILTIDNGTFKKDFIMADIQYGTLYGILGLTDGKSTIYLPKNKKFIRELKKLGAIKEELE